MSRTNLFYSLGVIPAFMGLGHLAPAIGAIHTATGSYQFPGCLLGLIGTISALVDSIDKYKDVPLSNRPPKWIWKIWTYGLWAIVLVCAVMSGLQTVILVGRVLPVGLLWGTRCIPQFSKSDGLFLTKPKSLLSGAKSLVVALCMASVSAEASMAYYCHPEGFQCNEKALRLRSFQLACLYQFLRETACDIRDIGEDTAEGLSTLPVKLGKQNTMLLMSLVGLLLDLVLTQSVAVAADGIVVRYPQLTYSFLRTGSTIAAYSLILQYPRENVWAWGIMSLFGLAPVLFAQAALRS
ncbi:hypothetical protein BP5796_00755 [Coleophoma crateriformis]|uniref:Uncharacterized protein n=1 Tax=Coleophoma crateriformis TaxID=565419 RepID=A0A3D8T8S2_9HELO|nr:hypothetical protein BP5796_00755 [Coleophoma crateriformis]